MERIKWLIELQEYCEKNKTYVVDTRDNKVIFNNWDIIEFIE